LAFDIPQPHHVIELRMDDGALIRVRRHGNLDGPRLVLSHGNGLAIDGYIPFWKLFCERYDVVVFDLRNHGQNPFHGAAAHDWPAFIRDAQAIWRGIAANWGSKPAAGVFHSLSGIVAIGQALELGRRWDLLILFEPPLTPPPGHALRESFLERQRELARRTLRRMERFSDPSEFARRLEQNPAFRRWVPQAYTAMAHATLRLDPTAGNYVLCCPRELEARIYANSEELTFWTRMKQLEGPVKLVCGDPSNEQLNIVSRVGRALADEYGFAFEAIPGASHFLQLEEPARCVQAVEGFLREYNFGR
jgi:pimeloyl-ACP methyl ester carboxylesterase